MQSPLVAEYTQKQVIEKTKHAAKVADELLQGISKIIKPGISENEAKKKAIELYEKFGIKKNWHIRHPEKSYGAFYEAVLI